MVRSDLKPVTFGSPVFRRMEFAGMEILDLQFPAGLFLQPHVHERTVFAVTIDGGWDSVIMNQPRDCKPGVVLTEPAGERHANHFGSRGARVLIVQADPDRDEYVRPCRKLLSEIHLLPHPEVTALARGIATELADPDPFSALAVQSATLEMFLLAARAATVPERHSSPPLWLQRAMEMARETYRSHWSLDRFAAAIGVHPAHLSRAFRNQYGCSLGAFIRRLRMEWAGEQLASSETPISRIAAEAGFADQSHFTRAFTKHSRMTPGAYRRAMSSRVLPQNQD
ncbi:MAG: AraC family transcriptional regulator [Bryobacteraceae bacterium]|nr:AraC family transcriptional regulator [Bryobacteraceae bacterium]